MAIPFWMRIYGICFLSEMNRNYISDKKQITYTYILTQNGIGIPVHLKFFRVQGQKHRSATRSGQIKVLEGKSVYRTENYLDNHLSQSSYVPIEINK